MWRPVTDTLHVGYAAGWTGVSRVIWRCTLECGHWAQVTAVAAPVALDCMACEHSPTQLQLPLFMPIRTERK